MQKQQPVVAVTVAFTRQRSTPWGKPIAPMEPAGTEPRTGTLRGIRTWAKNECCRREAQNRGFDFTYSVIR